MAERPNSKAERTSRAKKLKLWADIRQSVGKRYAGCMLDNFEITHKGQSEVVEKLRIYVSEMKFNIKYGRGIVLWGPPGTGKDHLLVAMIYEAIAEGYSADFLAGMDLFAERRDCINRNSSEKEIILKHSQPDVLVISDPVPPWGDLNQGQAEFLFRLIHSRYRDLKPTWVSANFSDGKDAKKRMGGQIIDRLKHDALSLHCNWPSYRKELDS